MLKKGIFYFGMCSLLFQLRRWREVELPLFFIKFCKGKAFSNIRLLPFLLRSCIAKKGSAKKASPWKFDYPLTNDAKISKLATLRQLKFLRLLIVEGPSLKFP